MNGDWDGVDDDQGREGSIGFVAEPDASNGTTRWVERRLRGVPPSWRRPLGSGVVAVVAAVLVAVPLGHLWLHPGGLHALLGDTLPLVVGLSLFVSSAWLGLVVDDDDLGPLLTGFWVVTGFGVAGLVAVVVFTFHTNHGHVVEAAWFLVADVAATGATVGLVVGRYSQRSRVHRRRLHRRERQFRAVFEGTLDALVVADDDGRYVAANPAAADLFGLPRSELVGRRVADFLDRDVDADVRWADFLDAEAGRDEIELVREDGEIRTVAYAATANVLPGRHLAALRDVTDRVERERERDDERDRVEFLNRLLRHNVLNGMNVVLARLSTLESAVPENREEELAAIRDRCDEVVELVQTARRLATRRVESETPIDLVEPLADAVTAVRGDHPDATVDVDRPDGPIVVDADATLERVFEHLVRNAVEHNDPETVHVQVDVDVDVGAETATVTVADDGVGIPADRRAELFDDDRFAHTRDWGGFGLSVVRVLVEEYGGDVRVEANDPRGTVVVVDLPLAD